VTKPDFQFAGRMVGTTRKEANDMEGRPRVNLVGAGNVGQTLSRLAAESGRYDIQDISNRTHAKAESAVDFVGSGTAVEHIRDMRPAEIWLLTTSDNQIEHVAVELARNAPGPSVAIHCSGFHTAEALAPLRPAGWDLASAHPVYSFADPETAIGRFPGTLCALEGDRLAVSEIQDFMEAIGAQTFEIQSKSKILYHGAAVITNNLTTVLQALALETWEQAGVPEHVRAELHAELLRNTVDNVLQLGSQSALTGPAARGDHEVVQAQAAAIANWHETAGAVYASLSEMAVALKTLGRTG
jgi:predicted short-subunit dehydrogenase-like oxidoreductase (DUF2520 family)